MNVLSRQKVLHSPDFPSTLSVTGPKSYKVEEELMEILSRPKIQSAYDRLHESGVIHHDVEPRHICIRASGDDDLQVRLIDFEGSSLVDRMEGDEHVKMEQEGVRMLMLRGR